MAKRNLSKKPKRKQLSRKLKRKTLNRKKGGRSRANNVSYPNSEVITRNSAEADESLRNICIGLLLFVVFILLPAAGLASRSSGSEYGGAPFQLPKQLKSCVINEDEFNEFMKKVDINGNMLTINDLTAEEITKLQQDDLLKQYIKADTTSVSFYLNNIKLDRQTFGNFIKKIGGLDSHKSVVDVYCIDDTVSKRF